jgi:hypothetical protein
VIREPCLGTRAMRQVTTRYAPFGAQPRRNRSAIWSARSVRDRAQGTVVVAALITCRGS